MRKKEIRPKIFNHEKIIFPIINCYCNRGM